MKIFGYDISFGKTSTQDAAPPEVEVISPGTMSPTKATAVGSPVLIFSQNGGMVTKPSTRRNIFEPAEYDLYEIGRIEDVDAYVRQAFKKKVGLFLKEGFDYVSSNKRAAKYIKTRFAQIARATSVPHEELIRRLVRCFVTKSNAFIVKVRDEEASGGRARVDINGKKLAPIAGLFLVAPEMMQVETDGSGKPRKWRQMTPQGTPIEFKPEDVVHFVFDRKEGFIFGTPIITPVIDDIRALRKIEENIELLIYKHLFPLFQYQVGTEDMPAGMTEDGLREIDVLKQEIQFMPTEGGIVTPERHKITAIGAESKALRAESYLEHFKKRVFSGLGMSAVDFGEPDTSNKSTADNMSRALVDDVKDFQQSFEAQFNEYIVNELLLESNFDEDMLLDENRVELIFREVDIDKQIKVENHVADLFAKHGVTWNEFRAKLGLDRILVPDDPESQDPDNFPEWFNTFWKLFHEPEKLINAGDEPYSANAKAAAEARSTSLTTKGLGQQQEAQTASEKAIAKARKPLAKKDNFLASDYLSLQDIVLSEVAQQNTPKPDFLRSKMRIIASRMADRLRTNMNAAFLAGFGSDLANNNVYHVSRTRREIDDRAQLLIKRLTHDIEMTLNRRIDTSSSDDRISVVRAIFEAFKYRTDFIVKTEMARANNLGKIYRAIYGGATKGQYLIQNETCEICKEHSKTQVHFEHYSLETVPPHHPGCNCGLTITEVKNNG